MYNHQCSPYIYGGLIYKPFTPINPHCKGTKSSTVVSSEPIIKEEISEPVVEEKVLEEEVIKKEEVAEALTLPEPEMALAVPSNNESGYKLKV